MQSFKITVDTRDFVVICLPDRPKALLDRTVAEIYEVETKRVNEAVRNNPEKFPEDFYFELTRSEFRELRSEVENFDLDWKGGHLPKAFTHLGCNMLATILKSKRAVQRAIQIIRTFTALESGGYDRRIFALEKTQEDLLQNQKDLFQKVDSLEKKQDKFGADLHFLLWEGQSETSPVLQIQKQIRRLEEKIETLFLEGRFRRLQLGEIHSDVVKLRKYVEEEVGKVQKDSRNLGQKVFHQEDKLARIGQEIGKLEQKIEAMLKQKKPALPKELPLKATSMLRISQSQAEELKELVHKKTRGHRKKIMALWRAFNEAFGIGRYKHLPQYRLDEAMEWVKGYGIKGK